MCIRVCCIHFLKLNEFCSSRRSNQRDSDIYCMECMLHAWNRIKFMGCTEMVRDETTFRPNLYYFIFITQFRLFGCCCCVCYNYGLELVKMAFVEPLRCDQTYIVCIWDKIQNSNHKNKYYNKHFCLLRERAHNQFFRLFDDRIDWFYFQFSSWQLLLFFRLVCVSQSILINR